VKIVTDYRTETSLRNGCNDILKVIFGLLPSSINYPSEFLSGSKTCLVQADCVNLLVKYYHEARCGVYMASMDEEAHGNRADDGSSRASDRSTNVRALDIKSRTRCGARCCLCFDPLPTQDISVIVFYCCHAYHLSCLEGGLDLMKSNSNQDTDNGSDDDVGSPSAGSRMRCVLCTTASS
jgi:vacuolar protein sorting-associated protein 41